MSKVNKVLEVDDIGEVVITLNNVASANVPGSSLMRYVVSFTSATDLTAISANDLCCAIAVKVICKHPAGYGLYGAMVSKGDEGMYIAKFEMGSSCD